MILIKDNLYQKGNKMKEPKPIISLGIAPGIILGMIVLISITVFYFGTQPKENSKTETKFEKNIINIIDSRYKENARGLYLIIWEDRSETVLDAPYCGKCNYIFKYDESVSNPHAIITKTEWEDVLNGRVRRYNYEIRIPSNFEIRIL